MRHKITMGIVTAIAVTAVAFTAPKTKHDTVYTIDTKSSTATWLGKKVTGQHTGNISILKGAVIANHGTITGGSVEFDMNSITCTDLTDKEWNTKLVNHLKADDFFGSAKYPVSRIDLTKITSKGENNYEITGKLTIKGVTQDITFPALIKMEGNTMVTVAKIMVDRTKFGIKYGSKTFSDKIGDKAIDDNFELSVNIVAMAGQAH